MTVKRENDYQILENLHLQVKYFSKRYDEFLWEISQGV